MSITLQVLEAHELQGNMPMVRRIAALHSSNDRLYTPTLQERNGVTTYKDLKESLFYYNKDRVNKGYVYILAFDSDEKLVGFNCHILTVRRIKGYTMEVLDIGTTSVHPNHQNKGIGQSMYSLLEGLATEKYGVHALVRTTWSTNLRQIHLYRKNGFELFIRSYDYYGVEGLDKLHYYKSV